MLTPWEQDEILERYKLRKLLQVWTLMKVVALAWKPKCWKKSAKSRPVCIWNKVHSQNKLSWVWFLTMFSAARKISMAKDWHWDCNCLSRRLQVQRPPSWKSVLGFSPSEDEFCSLKIELDRRTSQRTDFFVSLRTLQKLMSQTWKLPWFQVLVKLLGLQVFFVCYSAIHIE
jgi:hypothetical protein